MKEIKATTGETILVDSEDYPFLSRYTWHVTKGRCNYAKTNIWVGDKKALVPMHRLITGMRKVIIDHINRNPLDNRKDNLRACAHGQNQSNSYARSNKYGYKGVTRSSKSVRFHAQLNYMGKKLRSRLCETPAEAGLEYDLMAIKYHGEFAALNFPERARKVLK